MAEKREIAGDVSIGRHVSMGGDATVRGSATIGHNLKVTGWLEAKNIRGAGKGVFKNEEQLNTLYPKPQNGWYAYVIDGLSEQQLSECLGKLYIACGGAWIGQLNADGTPVLGGNPTVWSEANRADIEALRQEYNATVAKLETVASNLATTSRTAAEALEDAAAAQSSADNIKPRTVTIAEMDNLGTDGSIAAMLTYMQHNFHTRYRVVKDGTSNYTIGVMDVVMDNSLHVITEVLTTHLTLAWLRNPGDTIAHNCTGIGTYYRYFNINSPESTVDRGRWSEWTEAEPSTMSGLRDRIASAENKLKEHNTLIGDTRNSVDQQGGICPLDDSMEVPYKNLPELAIRRWIAEFDGFSDNTNASAETLNASSTDTGVTIIFDRYLEAFVAVKAFKAYRNWKDSADFGSNRGAGSEPYSYALYVNKTSDTIWKYIDGEMTQVGADMNEVRQYVAQAQEHADNAEQSVTDAAKWATSASDSATLSAEKAEQSSASATAAEQSNTESKANAHSAFLMASNAQNAANEAVESMNAASASATSASESAASASASKEEVANAITEHQAEMSTFSEQCKYRYVTLNFGANEETMQLANINGPALVLETVIMSNVERVYMTTSSMVKEDITGYTASSSTTSKIIEAYSFATFDIVRKGTGTASVGLKFKVQ